HGEQIGHSLLGIASQIDPGGAAQKTLRGPNGKPLAVIRGTGAEQRVGYVIPDRLGSVIGLIGANTAGGSNAVKIVSYAYDPYGNIRSAPGLDEPLAWWNTLTWTGAPRDHQTGLYRLGVRWYDPVIGRFTTPDPTSQETNPYTYAGGNPCNTTDPTGGSGGRMGCNEWGFVIAMAGVGVGTKVPHPYVTTVSAIFAVGGYGFAVLCSAGTASTSGSESSVTRSGRCFINSSTGARECP
ncbi:RHS repeat-associated core domain-containing protein, partial [Piscicoccus intestinalis]|uniref:RHS repeat-associated core domain-containing protein n=1 Tax=Piscicoccus intestinalis TaxID=746033 RepID=UPI0014702E09